NDSLVLIIDRVLDAAGLEQVAVAAASLAKLVVNAERRHQALDGALRALGLVAQLIVARVDLEEGPDAIPNHETREVVDGRLNQVEVRRRLVERLKPLALRAVQRDAAAAHVQVQARLGAATPLLVLPVAQLVG